MINKPTHHILLPENYTNANGEEKTSFTRVGSAWAKETGNLTCASFAQVRLPVRSFCHRNSEGQQGR